MTSLTPKNDMSVSDENLTLTSVSFFKMTLSQCHFLNMTLTSKQSVSYDMSYDVSGKMTSFGNTDN